MQSNDVIEVVTPLGGGISEVTLFPDAAAVLAGTAGVLVEPGRTFHAAVRHLSSLESDISPFVKRVEIPVIGRDGEIAGVGCRNLPLTNVSRSTPLTQDQDTAIIGEATKAHLHDTTNCPGSAFAMCIDSMPTFHFRDAGHLGKIHFAGQKKSF